MKQELSTVALHDALPRADRPGHEAKERVGDGDHYRGITGGTRRVPPQECVPEVAPCVAELPVGCGERGGGPYQGDLGRRKVIAPPGRFLIDDRQIRRDPGHGLGHDPKPDELRMVAVAGGLPLQDLLCQEGFAPQRHEALPMHIAPCGRTRRGDRLGPSPRSPIRANCLNLNQKKCKFLYDAHSALRADFGNINPCLRDRLVGQLRHRCRV